jgi:hypothetical protein
MHTLHYLIVKYRYRQDPPMDSNAHLIIPLRAGALLTAHPRSPEKSIPVASVTSARNTVRLQSGQRYSVVAINRVSVIFKSDLAGDMLIRIASQAFLDDDAMPTVLTAEPGGLGIVTSGLLRIGTQADVVAFRSDSGEKVMALRIDLTADKVGDRSIVFENIPDGSITLRQDGMPDKLIGKVVRNATGTGRIDGTEGIGTGNLSAVSPTSLVISSSPDTALPPSRFTERRGGVNITTAIVSQPYSMVIKNELNPSALRGVGFSGKSHIADVQRENGDWERFPAVVGHRADTLTRPHPKGPVVAIRFRPSTGTTVAQAIQAVAIQFEKSSLAAAKQRKLPIVSAIHTLRISPTDPGRVASIKIRISDLLFVMNVKPFFKTWDTTALPDGVQVVVVELLDESGALITTTRQEIFIRNRNLAAELATCQW